MVRGTSVVINESNGAHFYYRSGTSAAAANAATFSDVKAGATASGVIGMSSIAGKTCLGDNPAAGHKNNSPRTTITVQDSANNTVGSFVSPNRSTSSGSLSFSQPTTPNDTVYRGDFSVGNSHGFSVTLDMTNLSPGTYTVKTEYQDRVKTDVGTTQGACIVGRPNSAGTGVITGTRTSTTTFIYRPWQNTFTDMFGNGKVHTNTVPNEFQYTISTGGQTHSSAIYADYEHFYALPPSTAFLLPTDPSGCAADPSTCLPSSATPCDPSLGCVPRLVTINKVGDGEALQGVFDLETKAFIATASLASSGQRQLLVSLGTQADAQLAAFLAKLEANAASHGIDLTSLLATKVRISNGKEQLTLSLLDALQIAPAQAAAGVQIIAAPTVQAGIILDIYFSLSPHSCTTHAASSSTPPQRFTPSTSVPGFTVEKSDLLPNIPAVGPLGAIAGGPLYHITGNFPGGQLAASETATIVTGLDTAADEPNGYPVWVVPFLSSPHVATPTKMDFLGTATWSASETSAAPFAVCTVVDFMLGTGIALYNNPLPVGFGTLLSPLYKPSAASATLTNEINAAVASVVGQASTNPVVSALLTQIVGALP